MTILSKSYTDAMFTANGANRNQFSSARFVNAVQSSSTATYFKGVNYEAGGDIVVYYDDSIPDITALDSLVYNTTSDTTPVETLSFEAALKGAGIAKDNQGNTKISSDQGKVLTLAAGAALIGDIDEQGFRLGLGARVNNVATAIDSNSQDTHLATAKAIYDFVLQSGSGINSDVFNTLAEFNAKVWTQVQTPSITVVNDARTSAEVTAVDPVYSALKSIHWENGAVDIHDFVLPGQATSANIKAGLAALSDTNFLNDTDKSKLNNAPSDITQSLNAKASAQSVSDLTTANVTESVNHRYLSDNEKTKLANLDNVAQSDVDGKVSKSGGDVAGLLRATQLGFDLTSTYWKMNLANPAASSRNTGANGQDLSGKDIAGITKWSLSLFIPTAADEGYIYRDETGKALFGLSGTGVAEFAETVTAKNLTATNAVTAASVTTNSIDVSGTMTVVNLMVAGVFDAGSLTTSGDVTADGDVIAGGLVQTTRAKGIKHDQSGHGFYTYVAPPGATNSPVGDNAPSLGTVTSWALRTRVPALAGEGQVWENAAGNPLMSLAGNSGELATAGAMKPSNGVGIKKIYRHIIVVNHANSGATFIATETMTTLFGVASFNRDKIQVDMTTSTLGVYPDTFSVGVLSVTSTSIEYFLKREDLPNSWTGSIIGLRLNITLTEYT